MPEGIRFALNAWLVPKPLAENFPRTVWQFTESSFADSAFFWARSSVRNESNTKTFPWIDKRLQNSALMGLWNDTEQGTCFRTPQITAKKHVASKSVWQLVLIYLERTWRAFVRTGYSRAMCAADVHRKLLQVAFRFRRNGQGKCLAVVWRHGSKYAINL